uniref:Uncharacterized protein n=1 Tax=Monopterus albus TaxID=43700 RepID=A0A3Q3K2G6_MONAL
MTIGKNSRKTSVRSSIRAPKFLDKSSGFYGRLDEPETAEAEGSKEVYGNGLEDSNRGGGVVSSPSPSIEHSSGVDENEEPEVFDFSEGMMEDDGETLLQRKPSRHSSRWRRSSRRKQKEGRALDRAFRRGWEVFVTNLYSITLTAVTSSSPSSPLSKKRQQHNSVLAEFQ